MDATQHSVTDVELRQTGYVIVLHSPIAVAASLATPAAAHALTLSAGTTRLCVRERQYTLRLRGCFAMTAPELTLSATSPEVTLIPDTYTVTGSLRLQAGVGVDVSVSWSDQQ